MEQSQENKNEVKPSKEPDKPQKELTEEQRQKQKKFIIYPLMGLIFAVVMWLIFAPSEMEKTQEQVGFNTDVPIPTDNKLVDDKQTAYEQDMLNRKQEERRNQMQDLASMFGGGEDEDAEMQSFDEPQAEPQRGYGGSARPRETIHASANAYNDINRTLGNFYETPKEDPEKEEMRQKLEELNARLQEAETAPKTTMDDQIALMEKSYELAAKYMPQGGQGQPIQGQSSINATTTLTNGQQSEAYKNGKAQMNTIGEVREQVVSGLSQPMNDSTFIAEYSRERNMGFHTAVGTVGQLEKTPSRRASTRTKSLRTVKRCGCDY